MNWIFCSNKNENYVSLKDFQKAKATFR